MHKKGDLTYRQKRFVEEYLTCGNKTLAAERAGYKKSYVKSLFKMPAVQKYFAEKTELFKEMQKQIEDLGEKTYKLSTYLTYCVDHLSIRSRKEFYKKFSVSDDDGNYYIPGYEPAVITEQASDNVKHHY